MPDIEEDRVYPSAKEDFEAVEQITGSPQTLSPSYRLAFADTDFLLQDDLRPVRLQLELLKPELLLAEHGISSTVVVFGSARIPEPQKAAANLAAAQASAEQDPGDEERAAELRIAGRIAAKSKYYDLARQFAHLISNTGQFQNRTDHEYVVVTGGGEGIMEAANRGAHEAEAKSIGLNIVLPTEQMPNAYITPPLCLQFHYFAIRKMHFLMRARALAIFPGGFGTMDELFDALTLIQTQKIKPLPVILFGPDYWRRVLDFDAMVEEGTISAEDRDLISYVDDAEEAVEIIKTFYADRL